MSRRVVAAALAMCAAALLPVAPGAQAPGAQAPGKASWLTDGGDSERTSWQRNETMITPATVKDMKLLWTLQTDNQPRQLHNLFPPLIVQRRARRRRARARSPSWPASRTTSTASTSRKGRRSGSGTSTARYEEPVGRARRRAALSRRAYRDAGDRPDGHAGQVQDLRDLLGRAAAPARRGHGEDLAPAEPFLPSNGKPYALNLVNNVLYTTTAQGCGGNPNQFYAYDLATKKVGSFNPGSGGLWPRLGPSDRQGRHGVRRQRRRRLLPGAADLRAGDRRR